MPTPNLKATDPTASPVMTLRWCNDHLEMIDQRVLPARFEYRAFDSAAGVARGIREMVVRGAPAIGCAAAYGVALEALRLQAQDGAAFVAGVNQGLTVLAQSRPTAVNLFWALARMEAVLKNFASEKPATVASALLDEAHRIFENDLAANKKMGALGAALLPDDCTVLTYCNAGALATAGHGTALGVIRSARDAGKNIVVIACETRPFLQGARLTAWEMVQESIPVTLIADNMAGHLMSRGEVDAVIVGADRVAANGDVANKIGTYTLAVLAKRHGIPFYVACPLSTIDLKTMSGKDIPIEERAAAEMLGYGETRWAADGVSVKNPAFDVTPADLVTALITENGVVKNPSQENIAALM